MDGSVRSDRLIIRQSIRTSFCFPVTSVHLKILRQDESLMYSVLVKLGCVKLKNMCFDAYLLDENREVAFRCIKTFSRMTVWARSTVIGIVSSSWNCLYPTYKVRDPDGKVSCYVTGRFSVCSRFSDINYHILEADSKQRVACITKLRDGCLQKCASTRDKFVIHFSADLPPRLRAVILAATILIDVSHFE